MMKEMETMLSDSEELTLPGKLISASQKRLD